MTATIAWTVGTINILVIMVKCIYDRLSFFRIVVVLLVHPIAHVIARTKIILWHWYYNHWPILQGDFFIWISKHVGTKTNIWEFFFFCIFNIWHFDLTLWLERSTIILIINYLIKKYWLVDLNIMDSFIFLYEQIIFYKFNRLNTQITFE